jgi:hypothetical protein
MITRSRGQVSFVVFVFVAGCGGSPMTPAPTLSVSQAAVTLARTTSIQLSATASNQDVTSQAAWSSSNQQVATVQNGRITGIGPGAASVTAEHAGARQTVSVTVTRRLNLRGTITISNTEGRESLLYLGAFVDGREIAGLGTSGARPVMTIGLGGFLDSSIEPGSHELVSTFHQFNQSNTYATDGASRVLVMDRDTGEELASLPLAIQQKTTTALTDSFRWAIVLNTYTN